MAVYGVSPYAMPPEIAMGCMMNLRMVHGWRAAPVLLSIGAAFGNKQSMAEIQQSLFARSGNGEPTAQQLIQELKIGIHDQ
jgi:hypothetical protein